MSFGLAAFLGGAGVACIFYRPSFLGFVLGSQFFFSSAALFWVAWGKQVGALMQGHLFGVFIVLLGVAQGVGGLALGARLFFLKKGVKMKDFQQLKH
jgi:NADH:ubiquinone oxidoreductase subunit K